MSTDQAESIYLELLAGDMEQLERSQRTGRTHPDYTHRWHTPEAVEAQRVLGEERMQHIRFQFHERRRDATP